MSNLDGQLSFGADPEPVAAQPAATDIQGRLMALTTGQRARIFAAAERLHLETDMATVTPAHLAHYERLISAEIEPKGDQP